MSQPKIRHLPITDLARIAVEPSDLRRHLLRQVKSGGAGPNYNPTRLHFPGIVNRQAGVFEGLRDPWKIVAKAIVRRSRSRKEAKMNIQVARELYRYCESHEVSAVELDAFPISFSVGPKLEAWSPALFLYKDRATVPFLDLRRTRYLNHQAQRFVFSLQHHALRVNNPDYEEVEFQILQFKNNRLRSIKVIEEAGRNLFSYEQLETMISETQSMWFDVLAGREDELRKKGGSGSLL